MIANITQDRIDNGKRGSCSKCPVALELSSVFDRFCFVGCRKFWFRDDPKETMYNLPDEAISFISDFDDGLQVQPISFEVSLDG